jgi:8-oxo-dGTP pyrophosphatase MutT (NUDIX family)
MTVVEDRVINPGGREHDYGHVKFKNRAIGIVPLDDAGNTWLVGQYRYTLDQFSWEIPMGGGALEEAPLDAAKRELREETGLVADSWQQLMFLHTTNSITDEEGYVFVARDLAEGAPDFDDTEDLQIRKLPFSEALGMVRRGEITDVISIAGLLAVADI